MIKSKNVIISSYNFFLIFMYTKNCNLSSMIKEVINILAIVNLTDFSEKKNLFKLMKSLPIPFLGLGGTVFKVFR